MNYHDKWCRDCYHCVDGLCRHFPKEMNVYKTGNEKFYGYMPVDDNLACSFFFQPEQTEQERIAEKMVAATNFGEMMEALKGVNPKCSEVFAPEYVFRFVRTIGGECMIAITINWGEDYKIEWNLPNSHGEQTGEKLDYRAALLFLQLLEELKP